MLSRSRPLAAAVLALLLGFAFVTNAAAQERRVPTSTDAVMLSFAPVVKKVAPAVVNVYAAKVVQNRNPLFNDPIFRHFFGIPGNGGRQVQRSLGSGVIVDPRGLIVTNVHVILSVEKLRHKAEATIHISGADVYADSEEEDMYAAIDSLVDKLDRQIKKHKEKLTDHRREEGRAQKQPEL